LAIAVASIVAGVLEAIPKSYVPVALRRDALGIAAPDLSQNVIAGSTEHFAQNAGTGPRAIPSASGLAVTHTEPALRAPVALSGAVRYVRDRRRAR
jgi:hypothetical protein